MRSFISSSRTAILTAVLALASYCALIAIWRPAIHLYPDQDGFNLARAERQLLGLERPATVILGSSLGVRIPDDWLPKDWLNLSLGGKSAATGLALLAISPAPRRVLIEINTLDNPRDEAFIKDVSGSVSLVLRRWLPGLRNEYRPINLLLSLAGGWRGGPNALRGPGSLDDACQRPGPTSARDSVSAGMISREVARALLRPPAEMSVPLASLKAGLAALQAGGVEIVMFEWPVDPALMHAPRAEAIRAATAAAFPAIRRVTLDTAGFDTEDGLHLAPLSARRAACALIQAVGP